MTLCADIRPLLLEAEPHSLAGEGNDAVAEHVRRCPACAAEGRAILAANQALDGLLGSLAAPVDVDEVLRLAGEHAATTEPLRGDAPRHPRARRPAWRVFWPTLAAAAAVAGLLFLRPDAPPPVPLARAAQAAPPPLVESAPGRDVAVLPTSDPDITVLWFF